MAISDSHPVFRRDHGAEPVGSTPEELGVFFAREVEKYANIIAGPRIQAD